jgi:hypothetical protein
MPRHLALNADGSLSVRDTDDAEGSARRAPHPAYRFGDQLYRIYGAMLVEGEAETLPELDVLRGEIAQMLRFVDAERARVSAIGRQQRGWETRRRNAEARKPPPPPWHERVMDDD